MKNMDTISSYKYSKENKLQIVIDILKSQIDQYDLASDATKSRPQLKRWKKIQKLTSSERRLSMQFQQIRQEIQRYERKYEKLLKKKLKLMKVQIRENRQKLSTIKKHYQKLNGQVVMAPYQIKETKKNESKEVNKSTEVNVVKSDFKQKNAQFNESVKIRITQNQKLGKHEIHLIKDGNGHQTFVDPVNIVKPKTTNTRECKIMLEKLTDEQVRQYMSKEESEKRKIWTMRLRRDSLEKVNHNKKSTVELNWHIKIPKAVIDEIEKKDNSFDSNVELLKKISI